VLSYQIDHLFRSTHQPPGLDLTPLRAEAGRMLMTSSSHSGVSGDDRAYPVRLVTATTGLAGSDVEHRVDTVIANSKTAITHARASTIILAFSLAAALCSASSRPGQEPKLAAAIATARRCPIGCSTRTDSAAVTALGSGRFLKGREGTPATTRPRHCLIDEAK
jgi:hypothetical protein